MKRVKFVSVLVLAFTFICILVVNASSPRNYVYDTKEENGKIVSKVIFLQGNDGLLSKQMMYEFSYGGNDKVMEKKAYRWDNAREEWEPFYLIRYQYGEESGEIRTNYAMWDKKGKEFNQNIQNLTIPSSSYEEIFL
jgi:hypothetical protein